MEPGHSLWNMQELFEFPRIFQYENKMKHDGVYSFCYEGLPYEGRKTKVFAYYGVPKTKKGEQVPGMVLVHGGGGTAYAQWVKIWNDRGYAAMAMDLEGHLPETLQGMNQWVSHPGSGPVRRGIFADSDAPVHGQWMYHAVAAVTWAHTILRAIPTVDPNKIGLMGISWGSIVAAIAAGIDDRYAFAIQAYGCGYLYESPNQWGRAFMEMDEQQAEFVKQYYDPSAYLAKIQMPVLWLNMINDPHFPLTTFCKSYRVTKQNNKLTKLCVHPSIGHSHEEAFKPGEVYHFADGIVSGQEDMLILGEEKEENGTLFIPYEAQGRAARAELFYTEQYDDIFQAKWMKVDHDLAGQNDGFISVPIPAAAHAYFVNIHDQSGHIATVPLQQYQLNRRG